MNNQKYRNCFNYVKYLNLLDYWDRQDYYVFFYCLEFVGRLDHLHYFIFFCDYIFFCFDHLKIRFNLYSLADSFF